MGLSEDLRAALLPVWARIKADLAAFRFLSGNGVPADSLGVDGNLYFDKAGKALYGPKASGAWDLGVPLTGGAGLNVHPFAYGDASPALVAEVQPGQRVKEVAVQILVPFDGGGAALEVGDATDPGRLLPSAQVDPASEAVYIGNPGLLYPDGGELFLSIAPGTGASQGRGVVFITLA